MCVCVRACVYAQDACVRLCSTFLSSGSLAVFASAEGTRQYLREAVDLALACHQTEERGRDQEEMPEAAGVSWGSL